VPSRSAGLLVYRVGALGGGGEPKAGRPGAVEVLLVHPGGPYWARRDDGWWSIPKGEVAAGEDELACAEREFFEELGVAPPGGPRIALGEVVQAGGKRVHAWAVAGDVDVSSVAGGTFELEWPPRSGTVRTFPEVDRAAWFDLDAARVKLLPGQLPLLDRLGEAAAQAGGPAV
jgi:predicted NUDIX family NTP pyrophosphohydrolase